MLEGRELGKGQRVELWTDKFRFVGHVHIPQGPMSPRLSDVINDPHRMFLPLSRVSMFRRGDDQIISQQDFLLVNRSSIEVMRPLE